MKEALLENWMVVEYADNDYKLSGKAYGHERFYDGEEITTSVVKEMSIVNGFAITKSGTKYFLGSPDKKWIKWLEKNGYYESIRNINDMGNKRNN